MICAYSTPRSLPTQPCDMCLTADWELLSAAWSAIISRQMSICQRFNSTCQPLDQRLLAATSTSVNEFISTYHLLEHSLISCAISSYSTAWSVPVSHFISTCQPLYQHLSTAWSATTLLRDQFLLSHVIRDPQPVDQRLSAAWSFPALLVIPQESSPTPQIKSTNSSALSILYSPTLTSEHDYWKNHSFD